jgi:hypothetical protein
VVAAKARRERIARSSIRSLCVPITATVLRVKYRAHLGSWFQSRRTEAPSVARKTSSAASAPPRRACLPPQLPPAALCDIRLADFFALRVG